MNRNVLSFIALTITLLYAAGCAVLETPAFNTVGAAVVTLSWIAVGMFGESHRPRTEA